MAPRDGLTSDNWTTTSRIPWSSSRKLADGPRRSPRTECMLHGSDDPVLAIARRLSVSNARQSRVGPTHIVFNGQLLGHALEVPLAHFLETIPDVLLDKLFCFLDHLFCIFGPLRSGISIDGSFRNLWRGDPQEGSGVGLEESGQEW